MEYKKNRCIITHNGITGYSDVSKAFSGMIDDYEVADYFKAYMQQIVAYASDSRYAGAAIDTHSFISYKNYLMTLSSEPSNDGRTFLKSEVTICHIDRDGCEVRKLLNDYAVLPKCRLNVEFGILLRESMLLSMLSENTRFYCVTENKDAVCYLRNMYLSCFGEVFPKYRTYIEVLGRIPEVNASVITCFCCEEDDRNAFLSRIEKESNYVLLDWTTDMPEIEVRIGSPSFAQAIVSRLQELSTWNKSMSAFVDRVARYQNNFKNKKFSTICNLTALGYYLNKDLRKFFGNVSISRAEKIEMKDIY